MKIRKGNMQEGYIEFLEESMIELNNKISKKYPNDVDTRASMFLHIVDAIHATVLNICHPEDRKKFIDQTMERTFKTLSEVNEILIDNIE